MYLDPCSNFMLINSYIYIYILIFGSISLGSVHIYLLLVTLRSYDIYATQISVYVSRPDLYFDVIVDWIIYYMIVG